MVLLCIPHCSSSLRLLPSTSRHLRVWVLVHPCPMSLPYSAACFHFLLGCVFIFLRFFEDPAGNLTRDLPCCVAVPRPTVPPLAPDSNPQSLQAIGRRPLVHLDRQIRFPDRSALSVSLYRLSYRGSSSVTYRVRIYRSLGMFDFTYFVPFCLTSSHWTTRARCICTALQVGRDSPQVPMVKLFICLQPPVSFCSLWVPNS